MAAPRDDDAIGDLSTEIGRSDRDADRAGTTDDSMLRAVLGAGARPPPVALLPGQLVGGTYRIVRLLGAGGMGVVYLARDVRLERDVAIKLHATGGSPSGMARLVREAQAIAQLSHANVVTVYQVDSHDGHPFVAMEYVDGGTARTWLAAQPRSWPAIVELYLGAGRGLAAAHQAGLVHRDFKPDNVLVGTDGRVRVADFGLVQGAWSSSSDDRERTADDDPPRLATTLTRTGAVMGTPAYMAPEQHRGEAVGAAADQFAFAVALWEALTGARPFAGATTAELAAALARPPGPPTRPMPAHLEAALRRALAADATARWPTMAPLLAALARDPAARRRRRVVGALAAAAIVGAGGAAFAWTRAADIDPCADPGARLAGAWDDTRRRDVERAFAATGVAYAADTFARTAAQLDRYADDWTRARLDACRATRDGDQSPLLLDLRYRCLDQRRASLAALVDLFAAGPDPRALERAVTAARGLEALDACDDVPRLLGAPALPRDPAVRAEIVRLEAAVAAAEALHAAGRFADGVASARTTSAAARATAYPPLVTRALGILARLEGGAGDYPAAKLTAREAALAAASAHDDRGAADIALFLLQVVTNQTNELDEAEALVSGTQAAVARAGAPPGLQVELDSALGALRRNQGRFPEARALLEAAVTRADRELPADADITTTLIRLATVLSRQGEDIAARRYAERAIAWQERTLGDHPYLAMSLRNLGGNLLRSGDNAEALAVLTRALTLTEKVLGPDHRNVAGVLSLVGVCLRRLGRYDEARPYLERALAIAAATYPAGHPEVALALNNYAGVFKNLGRPAEALPLFERALAALEAAKGPDHPDLAESLMELAEVRSALGDRVGARRDLERAHRVLVAAGAAPLDVAATLAALASMMVEDGEIEAGVRQLRQALAMTIEKGGADHPQIASIRASLGAALIAKRDWAGARSQLEAARAGFTTTVGADAAEVAGCLRALAEIELANHRAAAAVPLLERAVAIYERTPRGRPAAVAETRALLARARAAAR